MSENGNTDIRSEVSELDSTTVKFGVIYQCVKISRIFVRASCVCHQSRKRYIRFTVPTVKYTQSHMIWDASCASSTVVFNPATPKHCNLKSVP